MYQHRLKSQQKSHVVPLVLFVEKIYKKNSIFVKDFKIHSNQRLTKPAHGDLNEITVLTHY